MHDKDLMSSNIICLQETYLRTPIIENLLPEYRCFTTYKVHGIMTCVQKTTQVLTTTTFTTENVEAILISFLLDNQTNYVCNIYARPTTTLLNSITIINKVMTTIPAQSPIYIVGDFNIDVSKNSKTVQVLKETMHSYNLQLLQEQTDPMPSTITDHFWTNNCSCVSTVQRLEAYWTDHDILVTVIANAPTNHSYRQIANHK